MGQIPELTNKASSRCFAVGALKLGDSLGSLGIGIRGKNPARSLVPGIGAYLSARFLVGCFRSRTLTPFAIYSVVCLGLP